MKKIFVLKDEAGDLRVSSAMEIDNSDTLSLINHPVRIEILKLISKTPMYPAEIAQKLNLHEQKVYYHIKQLINAGVLEVKEKKSIRGTTAKKFIPVAMNFILALSDDWQPLSSAIAVQKESVLTRFYSPFIKGDKLDSFIIVGSPDPHGPHLARARDGHYAIDLAAFLGKFIRTQDDFITKLDVDVKADKAEKENLIIVGGPVTNLLGAEINPKLPVRFSDEKPFGIISERTGKKYSEDTIGLIARVPNPFNSEKYILYIAGIRYVGTKAAVMALTKNYNLTFQNFSGQKEWCRVVNGVDKDGDGKIDSIEVLE